MDQKELNSLTLDRELEWLSRVIDYRFEVYFSNEIGNDQASYNIEPPNLDHDISIYAKNILAYSFNFLERLTIALALAPHIRPQVLDSLRIVNKSINKTFTEFGGKIGINHNGFLPTGETVAFLYSGKKIQKRLEVNELFSIDHNFHKNDLIYLNETKHNEPFLSGQLTINNSFLELITMGFERIPTFNSSFPARMINVEMSIDELILSSDVKKSLENLNIWLQHNRGIYDNYTYKIKKGYKALFYGPPGTGKTLTAGLIGKTNKKKVFRVDLSHIQSKWVGETEKTLSKLFNKADNKGWILFFDEADSIFGKRSDVGSSNETYANQTVSYLLQRIEDYNGMIILATNFKGNIDNAFIRRFQSIIHFPLPDPSLRMKMWQSSFKDCEIDDDIDIKKISKEYELSGAAINNIFNYCILKITGKKQIKISRSVLLEAIRYELRKEGKY